MPEMPFDARRRLCPDGTCIGVIGPDGACSVCGRRADGGPGAQDPGSRAIESDGGDVRPFEESFGTDEDAPAYADRAADEASVGFDPSRRLCEDGACVGVIGADGACGTCGKRGS
jgi:hypothetical protein